MYQKRFAVRKSGLHGRGVFALQEIPKGTRLMEYKGEIVDEDTAGRRYARTRHEHTMLVSLGDREGVTYVIDGNVGGNSARFINHGCNPNCALTNEGNKVAIWVIRKIKPGQELLADYSLICEDKMTAKVKKMYKCLCGSRICRGTMLAKA